MEAAENTAEANMAVDLDFFLLSLTIHHWPSSLTRASVPLTDDMFCLLCG